LSKSRTGLVMASHGRHYAVQLDDSGPLLHCYTRGKKSHLACGDRVRVEQTAEDQGVVTELLSRSTLLYRSDAFKQKLIAANVTHVVIVVATEPSFSPELVSRCLAAAESENLAATIVLNKIDLAERLQEARMHTEIFRQAGYTVLELCAKQNAAALEKRLAGQRSILIGQSGMGKSTLVNHLVPDAEAATREISAALDSGKHTTTLSRVYCRPDGSQIIDSPGLQVFGLAHLTRQQVEHAFIEFRPYLGKCRFRDCRHGAEPDCGIRGAMARGVVSDTRFGHMQTACAELPAQAVALRD
jgi:ribosome biogenesis GTPase / thiamine phosphate phosphatase